MRNTEEQLPYALAIRTESRDYVWRIVLNPMRYTTRSEWESIPSDDALGALDDLTVDARFDPSRPSNPAYSWATEYENVYSLDIYKAKTIYETLARIQKKLDAMKKVEGGADSFGQYALRVARALGMHTIIRLANHTPGSNHYQEFTLAEGQSVINQMIATWQYEQTTTAMQATA